MKSKLMALVGTVFIEKELNDVNWMELNGIEWLGGNAALQYSLTTYAINLALWYSDFTIKLLSCLRARLGREGRQQWFTTHYYQVSVCLGLYIGLSTDTYITCVLMQVRNYWTPHLWLRKNNDVRHIAFMYSNRKSIPKFCRFWVKAGMRKAQPSFTRRHR